MQHCTSFKTLVRTLTHHTALRLGAIALALAMALAAPFGTAYAADLASAKASGQVGEQLNGLLGLVNTGASGEIKALVANINGKRQAEYARIAKKNNVSPAQVGKLTARKVINAAPAGTFVQTSSGKWTKK